MCLSEEIDDKWTPFVEFMIFFIFQGYNVAAHFGIWIIAETRIVHETSHVHKRVNISTDLNNTSTSQLLSTTVSSILNSTKVNSSNNNINSSFSVVNGSTGPGHVNHTISPEEIWADLLKFREIFYIMCCVGAVLFVIQLTILLPNVVKHFLESDVAVLKDEGAHCYYRNVFLMNVGMLILTSVVFDIPIAVLTIRLLEDIWKGDALTEADKLDVSKTMITLSLTGLAFMALYKGMMPLFMWVGNPFCFPCVPLRMLVVLPGGLVALVMTFAPPMGYAKHGLLTFAPTSMQQHLGDVANTFFSIGMIFWGVFIVVIIIVTICYYKFCREDAESSTGCLCC